MFTGWNGAGCFISDAIEIARCHIAKNGAVGVGQGGQHRFTAGKTCAVGPAIRCGVDKFCFPTVPLVEQLHGRGTADQTWVRDSHKPHTGDVA